MVPAGFVEPPARGSRREGPATAPPHKLAWLDYLFAGSAADRVGVSFRPVASGTHVQYQRFQRGALRRPAGSGELRPSRKGTYTLAVSEMKRQAERQSMASIPSRMKAGLAGCRMRWFGRCRAGLPAPLTWPFSTATPAPARARCRHRGLSDGARRRSGSNDHSGQQNPCRWCRSPDSWEW